jgi:hypothetical protein
MNIDQGYYDISSLDQTSTTGLKLDNLPNDYFYSTEYEYMTLPEVQLLLILSDSNITYSFSGLRKTTDLHQHQLTKALKRLQERKYLLKNDLGTYELTHSGSRYTKSLIGNLLNAKAVNIQEETYNSQWRKIRTFPPLERNIISSVLEQRWFGDFRFLYKKQLKNHIRLCWEDSERNSVFINIHDEGTIDIEFREIQSSNSGLNLILNWVSNELSNLDDVSIEVYEDDITTNIDKMTYN